MEGEVASAREVHCTEQKAPLEETPHEERETNPKPSEPLVFTRRNPKRSARDAQSDLNIDRLTRICNPSRKSRREKESFDPALLVSLIRDPNLTTRKRKPLNRRVGDTVWGEIKNLSHILDIHLECCKLKHEKEVISNQFVVNARHLKQEEMLERDLNGALNVQRAKKGREIAGPGSSPDSVVYNPVSCEANRVVPQHKQSTKSKKKKKKEGGNVNSSKRDGVLDASDCVNQGGLYYLQVDAMGRPIFNGIKDEKVQDLSAPGAARMYAGNMPETNNEVSIASLSGSFSSNGTREPFRYESFMAQLLLPVRLFVPVPPGSLPVPMQSVASHSIFMPGQLVTVPGLLRQPLPVCMDPTDYLLRPLHMPENSTAAAGEPMQVKEQHVLVPLQLEDVPAQPVPVTAKPAPPKSRVAWVCCDECGKWRCIPAELADAIDETNCRWTCKDNAAKAFADCSIPQEKSNAEINAELEISDASGDEGPSGRGNESGDVNYTKPLVGDMRPHLTKSVKNALGPAPYTPLKMNFFLHRNRKTQTIDEIMVCNCKPPENGGLGCRSQCLNRMLSIECIKGMCPCGDLCSNQQFQRRNYAKLMYFRCGKKGYGLQLLEDVTAGRFLIEYVGEVLDMATYEARQKEYATIGHKHFYFMTLNGGEVIDACAKGNLGRFINHSCDPNCRTEKWIVNGEVCIGIFAIRDIKKGEELTFDYNYVRVFGAAAKKCFCGSVNCQGYIGGDPSSTELVVQEDSDEEDHFEPVKANREERKEPIHRAAAIATLSNSLLNKHPVPNKSLDMFGSFTPVVQKDNSVEMHKLSYRERLMGCKPDSAVSLLANSLVNGTMDEALALPANSQQAFGLLPRDNFQSVIHPENSLKVSKSKNRENLMRHNTDTVLIKPSDSKGVSNGGGLSRSISADSSLKICKTEYRGDISQCKPDSILSLPTNSHEVSELLDKEADKNRDMKDVSLPSSSSSIAVPSYSLLKLHLPKVNSLVELKMGDRDGLPNNSVNEYKPPKKESLLQGLSEKAVPLYNSLEECELVDREELFQAPPEDCIHDNNSPYEFCTENRDVDDVSTPVLPDHSVEQDPVGTDIDNLCKSLCVPVSHSNGFALSSSLVPEHLSSSNEGILSEEDAPGTPVHVTRYLSNRVHSRRSDGMEADKMSSKPGLCNKPSDSFDVQPEQVDLDIKKVDQHGRTSSPPVGTCGMKTVLADAEDEGLAMCQEVNEIVHNTATLNFEEVEEKLNEFLDKDGCISRRTNATKGYLKLLFVTAVVGDTGTSQRLRDVSLILDALLKTKSYNVLMDLMKKNGLQMLHTILKQNRDNFNWIPIIRKLLRVLGHLGNTGVLTLEQMNQGPPCPGMESLRESIYKLTKHKNNMVHLIAREFFDRWMPKSMRVYDSFSHTSNSSAPSKRKSLWDHPSDSHSQDPKLAPYNSQNQQVGRPAKRPRSECLEEDAPPGFEPIGPPPGFGSDLPPDIESVSPPGFGSDVQPTLVSVSDVSPVQVALGFRQEKYRPGISVSYGIPAAAAQNLGGFVESEGRVVWGIAPSIPFQPFPPLPPYHTIGNRNGEKNGPGFCYDRARRRWGSNLRNQRRYSKSWNNNDDARDRSNNKRSGKYRPKWPRDRNQR